MSPNILLDNSLHDGAAPERPYGIAIGIALSLALHALIIYGYRADSWPQIAPDRFKPAEQLTVWLRPPPAAVPVPPPAPPKPVTSIVKPAEKPPAASRKPLRKTPEKKPVPAASTAITLPAPTSPETPTQAAPAPAAPDNADSGDPFAEAAPRARPKFDIDAARRIARQVASERDPAKVGTAVGQIPDKPLPDETPLARHIGQAKRADCRDGIPGGLLAPLFLLMDKKDSGCKW
ncbi:MAG TPA: hypothetical protein VGP06_00865 [Janthinobacterium sp.]|nr:hypothetical protein [Janthinobacterium sp.]